MNAEAAARFDFASDNTSGLAPQALEAIVQANRGHVPSYGADDYTRRASDLLRSLFDIDGDVYFLSNGTAANSLALATICSPHEGVAVHRSAHILTDEAGAPGFFGGGMALLPINGEGWKIEAHDLDELLAQPPSSNRHRLAALSLTNATEFGGVYDDAHFSSLVRQAHQANLKVHVDGARLANAAAAGFDVRSLGTLPVDVLVVGGAKAGLPGTEALILRNGVAPPHFVARLKQTGQLISKGRMLAAPWIGMLEGGAWLAQAVHANRMAARLAAGSPFPTAYAVESNAVFLKMPAEAHLSLARYGWITFRFSDGSVRFMCSWATTEESVDDLLATLDSLA